MFFAYISGTTWATKKFFYIYLHPCLTSFQMKKRIFKIVSQNQLIFAKALFCQKKGIFWKKSAIFSSKSSSDKDANRCKKLFCSSSFFERYMWKTQFSKSARCVFFVTHCSCAEFWLKLFLLTFKQLSSSGIPISILSYVRRVWIMFFHYGMVIQVWKGPFVTFEFNL